MTDFSELESQVQTHAPQADVILMADAIRHAVQVFCEKTLLLETITSPRLTLVADEPLYTLPAVDDRVIVRIKRGEVWFYDSIDDAKPKRLDPTNPNELDQRDPPYHGRFRGPLNYPFNSPDKDWRIEKGRPQLFYQPLPHQIRIVPMPRDAWDQALKVTYCLKPSNTATEVDDFIVDQWRDILVEGALGELLQIKHKPWTDVAEGEAYEKSFDMMVNDIVREREKSFESLDKSVGRVKAWP